MARVVVVGGGFGGLASALRLAKLGHQVTLVEERALGGALVPVTADGFAWDVAGHTLLPAVVRDLFRKTGRPLEKEVDLVQLDCVREHWFADGSSLVLTAGRAAQRQAFDALGPGLGQPWLDHVEAYADDWEVLRRGYLEVPWDPEHAPPQITARLDSRESLQKRLRRSLPDPRARLVAAYPFEVDGHEARDVPAWAGLASYLEQRFGVWAVAGGTGVLLEALVRRLGTRGVEVATTRATDLVVRGGRVAAVRTNAGELAADVVVCAVDPRRLPALAPYVVRTTPAIPPALCHVGLEGEVRDLPHELVVHGDALLTVRTRGRAPDGRHAWTVASRGRLSEDPLTALARHGLDVRAQVVTRLDRSPRDLVDLWGGTPLGVQWAGRATVRRRLGPRTPVAGVYAAGSHASPGSGLPFVGPVRGAGRAGRRACLTRPPRLPQLEGDRHRGADRGLPRLERRSLREHRLGRADRSPAEATALDEILHVSELRTGERREVGRSLDRIGVRRLARRPGGGGLVGHLERDRLDLEAVSNGLCQGGQQPAGRLDARAAHDQRVTGLEPGRHPLLVVVAPDLQGGRADLLGGRELVGRRRDGRGRAVGSAECLGDAGGAMDGGDADDG